jgi:hypothetical protein
MKNISHMQIFLIHFAKLYLFTLVNHTIIHTQYPNVPAITNTRFQPYFITLYFYNICIDY